jgi:hypothetical protein
MLTNSKNEKESVFHITKNQTIFSYNQESNNFKYSWISGGKKNNQTKMAKIGPKQKIIIIETETRKGRSRSTS